MRHLAAFGWRSFCAVFIFLAGTAAGGYGNSPLAFEKNVGQTDPSASFLARGRGFQLFLTPTEAVYRFPGSVLRMRLDGGGPGQARGVDPLPSRSNYLDRTPAIVNVPHFARVEMSDVYPGINLSYYGTESRLEYDFLLAPGGDPHRIAFQIDGADEVRITRSGELRIRSGTTTMVWRSPRALQDRTEIACRYRKLGPKRVGFDVAKFDRSRSLVIDPILAYSTTIGGSGFDRAFGVAVDGSGCAIITGQTASVDFPTTAGAYSTSGGGVFVSKLSASGTSWIYSTFLGAGQGNGVAIQGSNAYVVGTTASSSFPVTTGAYNDFAPGNNAFVAKLTSDGSGLVYSSVFGHGSTQGAAIAVDAAGIAHVTGVTQTDNFPTTAGAFQPTRPTLGQIFQGDMDAFYVKLNATGTALLYSTYLGSNQNDVGESIAVDSAGSAYIGGVTVGVFPTTAGAYQTTFTATSAAFVTKFTANGAVAYSTVLTDSNQLPTQAHGIAVDASGEAYITGATGAGAFMAKFNASGSSLADWHIIAGAEGRKIAVDSSNNVFVAGVVNSGGGFTPVNPLPGVTGLDLFLTKFSSNGSVDYSTYIDGHLDVRVGVAVDPSGAAYVAGTAFPAPFNTDAFVTKIVTNRAPLADAGADQSVNMGNAFTLDGGGSSDPDGNPLTYVWTDSSNTVIATTKSVTLTRSQGTHTFTLTVSDGSLSAADSVVVTVNALLSINLFGGVDGTVTSNDARINCSATASPLCVARYATPDAVTLTATPGTGVAFSNWKFDCSGTAPCSLTMNSNHTVGAQFAVQQLTLAVSSGGNGKVISPAGIDCGSNCSLTVPYGTIVTLTTVPASGYLFDAWSGDCAATTASTCTLTMNGNKSAGAAFKEITLNALAVSPASATVAAGGQQLFTAEGTFSDGSVRAIRGDHTVEATDDYTCAITTSGAVKCWGGFPYQTLTTVPAFEKAVELSAGTSHVCALFANGAVACDGPPPGITNAVAIASESGIACALLAAGTVKCWATGSAVQPVSVAGINNAVAIGAEGGSSACAVLNDGTVSCWVGLGDTNGTGSSTPVAVSGITNAVAVAVGAEHSCALLADGTIKCWGRNNRGQLGDGSVFNANSFSSAPVSVVNVTGATNVVTGDYHTCALLTNGTAKCWGMQDANGSLNDSSTPVTIAGLTNAVALSAGAFHNCATFANGSVQCWGLNNVGQLGAGNPATSLTPLPVNGLTHVLALSWSSSSATARLTAGGRAIADLAGSATVTATAGAFSAAAALTIVNTPAGTNVVTKPADAATGTQPATVTFAGVTTIGSTTLNVGSSGPTPPAGFQLGSPAQFYDVATTATYSGPVSVCIDSSGIVFPGQPQLFHYEGGAWKDVTTSFDTARHIVCGSVTSLSPFALFARCVPVVSSAVAVPNILWPPNHKMVPVTIAASVADACDPSARCRIETVTGNERIDGDWEKVSDLVVNLRAERSGNSARVYTITLRCFDAFQNSATRAVTVTVPDHQ